MEPFPSAKTTVNFTKRSEKILAQNDFERIASKNTALPHAPSISCAHLMINTTLSAKTICVQINWLRKKQNKQSCLSQRRCQVCSEFHHTTLHDPVKQIKRPTAAFYTEVFSANNPTASSSSKASSQTTNTSQRKSQTNKTPNSRYGQNYNNQSRQNV